MAPGNLWVLGKYILFQLPGWALAAGLAWWAHTRWGWPASWVSAGVGLFVLKDAILFPFVKHAYSVAPGKGAAPEPGSRVIAAEDIDPKGYARIAAELWKAELAKGAEPIRAGEGARIRSVEGLTLIVVKEDAGD